VVSFFGDGASNQGACHEAMNLAAIWKLPVIFLCENNQYAVTTSFKDAVAVENISDRASAYNMPGVLVTARTRSPCTRPPTRPSPGAGPATARRS
jgi:pyruvate dehydrogenase E1 component alpha subunit